MRTFSFAVAWIALTSVSTAQTAQDRTEAKDRYQQAWFALEAANNGTHAQVSDDITTFKRHEDTQPQGQAAYDASGRIAQAEGYAAASEALRTAAFERLNQDDHPGNAGAPFAGRVNGGESVLDAAYRHYAAGSNDCIPLFSFAETLCELVTLDIMSEQTKETQNAFEEAGEFNAWENNQRGQSGY